MIEWIVILTWVYNYSIFCNQDKVYISSDTQTFSQQWNNLTAEERKNATVVKGQKFTVLPELKLVEEKSFKERESDIYISEYKCPFRDGHNIVRKTNYGLYECSNGVIYTKDQLIKKVNQ